MLVFGHTIEELDVVDSTNDYLIEKSKQKQLFEGEVVMAHFQTNGRGQRESSWESSPGENLMCSIFTLPSFLNGDNFFLISKAIALAVKEVVKEICVNDLVEVKWPNDIYINRRKIGGILIENQFKGSTIKQSIIGLGLNINQTNFENSNATSLKLEKQKNYNVKETLVLILQRFEYYYLSLKRGKKQGLEDDYLKSLMNYNQVGEYTVENTKVKGLIKDVFNNGLLAIEIEGEMETFQFKEIQFNL